MKKILLVITLALFNFSLQSQEKSKIIEVDVKKSTSFSLSQIVEEITMVTLSKPNNLSLYKISKILLIDNFLYVLSGSEENKGFPEYVLQFDLKGNFIKELDRKNKETGELMEVTGLFYSDDKIYVRYKNKHKKYAVFNSQGDFEYSKNNNDSFICAFNNGLWNENVSFDFDKGIAIHTVEKRNRTTNKVKTILKYKENLKPKFIKNKIKGSILADYSVTDNKLFIAVDHTKTVYIMDNENKMSAFQFNLKNNSPSTFSIKPLSCGLNNYIKFGYMSGTTPYIYLYNIKDNTGNNIKISWGKNRKLISGIQDDILNTGFVNLRNTNVKELGYFTKRKYDLPEIFNESDDSDSVVFIVKLK
ncbi:hypothetical protein [Flavivirga rizhaonensis]|uniref:6-bladed beta-propeller n=1 Tax=Flavivirga rizhaonensis TaxID=2559571 RepID=A0A4S1DYV3_9FLAO|nr:hypothetical protein [Flavivirga rizhaonensis]TGV03407.1 hypothetical protein EM932_06965 [Flavivirga rizhaonensis]